LANRISLILKDIKTALKKENFLSWFQVRARPDKPSQKVFVNVEPILQYQLNTLLRTDDEGAL
jgi:hypothetical protein